ncbi:MAG: capsular polysaccharide biosynthesis protein [Ruminococcus sp.]|nr:capsular polysaccharide biosynthesis protein [Ruminococcus sp.]
MVDFHSHILPAVDDGSKNTSESLKLLSMLSSQGVDLVCATPHYLADRESVDEFIIRRDASYNELKQNLSSDSPEILLGAEVAYYDGLSNLDNLEKLCIGDSRLLLVEMPQSRWSEYTIKELINLACSNRFTIVLAHIERYEVIRNRELLERLLKSGILLQINASFINGISTRRRALRYIADGWVHFIGSDCHDTVHRPPFLGKAYSFIERKLGTEFLSDYAEFQREFLFDSVN